jgi:hypothetical protein
MNLENLNLVELNASGSTELKEGLFHYFWALFGTNWRCAAALGVGIGMLYI